jgi:hypothetical protein
LTQEDLDNGDAYTREDAEGSYAFYHNKRNGKYKNGKVAHLWRMWIKDSVGTKVYCDMDLVGNILTVTMPQDSLDSMIYPVILGPTIGYSSQGAVTEGISGLTWFGVHPDYAETDTSGGTVTTLNAWISGADAVGVKMGITDCHQTTLDPTGESVIAQGATTSASGSGVEFVTMAASGVLLASTKYNVCLTADTAAETILCDTGAASFNIYGYNGTFATEISDPIPALSQLAKTRFYSMWADYTSPTITAVGGGLASDAGTMFLASGGSSEL